MTPNLYGLPPEIRVDAEGGLRIVTSTLCDRLANRVVAPEALMAEARALADKLMKQPRQALEESKKILNLYLRQNAAQVLDTTLARQLVATLSPEHNALARTFLARR